MFRFNRFSLPRTAMQAAFALAAVVTLGGFDATPASAQGAWCAEYSGKGGTNCGFYTLDQCRAAVSGVGGTCSISPWVRYGEQPVPPRRLRRQYY
jgi:hypothetical protein